MSPSVDPADAEPSSTSAAAPPLRWSGSKRALIGTMRAFLPARFTRYVEPFAGSACLFFALAPAQARIGDFNDELIEFYRRLRYRPRKVATLAAGLARDAATYYEVRAQSPGELDPDKRAARFLYLNRMSFNGVYRTNRRGEFNVPVGRRVGAFPSVERVAACARLLRQTELVSGDFTATLDGVRRGDFVYLDPPYSRSSAGAYGVYGYGSFDRRELARLTSAVEAIDSAGATFLLSYEAAPEVIERFEGFRMATVAVTAQVGGRASSRSTRRELLVSNAA